MLSTVATLLVLVAIFYLLGRKFPSARSNVGSGPNTTVPDKISAARAERENPSLIQDDMRQMFKAQNELRRRRGAPEMSEDELRAAVAEDERHRMRGRGPFGLD